MRRGIGVRDRLHVAAVVDAQSGGEWVLFDRGTVMYGSAADPLARSSWTQLVPQTLINPRLARFGQRPYLIADPIGELIVMSRRSPYYGTPMVRAKMSD